MHTVSIDRLHALTYILRVNTRRLYSPLGRPLISHSCERYFVWAAFRLSPKSGRNAVTVIRVVVIDRAIVVHHHKVIAVTRISRTTTKIRTQPVYRSSKENVVISVPSLLVRRIFSTQRL